MEATGGPRGAKIKAKDPFWGAQMQLNGAKGKPEDFYKRASEGIVRARTRWAENAKMLQIDL